MTAGERSQGQGQGDAAVAAARAGLQAAGGAAAAAAAAAEEIRAQTKQVAVREGQPDLTGEGMAPDNANEAEQPEDSKDEKPLAYRKKVLQMAATHGGKSGDGKPPVPETPAAAVGKKGVVTGKLDSGTAAMKVMGRKMAGKQEAESATGKRPLEDKAGSPNAAKKLKPSVPAKASGAAKAKEEPDFHDSDEDDIPLAQRRALRKVSEAPVKDGNSGIKRPLDGKGSTSHTPAAKKVKPSAKEEPSKGKAEVGKGRQSGKAKDEPAKVKEELLKREPDPDNDDDDDVPLAQRVSASKAVSVKKVSSSSGAKVATKKVQETKTTRTRQVEKTVKKKVVVADKNGGGGQKWSTLEHNGVIFPPPYQPHGVKMLYDGKPVDLTERQEEVATMFAVMKDTEYASKERFITNFWNDWKPLLGPGHVIKKFELCDFTPIYEWNLQEKEKKKLMSTEEKKRLKEEKLKMEEKYMWALVDGVKEKVGNFRVEPPGLFRGRGDHPKMGKLKKRIQPKDIVINIGKDAPIPECPIPNTKWKEVRHDNTVTWLAYWNDPINPKDFKYVGLAASSSLKGQSDKEKYEKARLLKDYIDDIRKTYTKNFTSQDMTKRQISVATYLIDRLALRAGNEKDEEEADTVGCCSLKVEHVSLVPPRSLEFDFLGKDSIRYNNTVEVEEKVYKAIGDFKKGKKEGQDLFDKLDTNKLNAHLKEIMPNLTAKVFRTYNASITLDNLLFEEESEGTTVEKIADYQRANKEVAILCNHQRTVSKTHGAQMEKLQTKMADIEAALEELTSDLEKARKGRSLGKDKEGKPKRNMAPEMIEKKIAQHTARLDKMKVDMSMKDDLKTVALGTSKINYMDPRITVAWCKRHEVPIEKIFNKSLLAKFAWAMDVEPDYRF